ncbi:MAG: aldehyde ferredoxin oxidoreductase C-terminal domain-containing protein [Promethearchaeia archaeon]
MKLARINVEENSVNYEEITKDSEYFLLGARALTSQIVYDEVDPKADPLGEKNKVILANGVLTGSPFPNSGRTSVGGKSPLTGGIKESNVGGRPSLMLARHGIRALILEDKSPEWKIIILDQNGLRLESANEYQGLGNYKIHETLRNRFGERVGIYSIGPAGEHMMKSATIAANDLEGYPSRHAARGGLGSVMGSKKIKAIVIIPPESSNVKIEDLQELRKISKPFTKNLAESKETFSIFGTALMMKSMSEYGALPTKNFRKGSFDKIDLISGEKLNEIIEKRGGKNRLACSPACVIRCSNLVVDEGGNHVTSSLEYETITMNGSNLLIDDLDALAKIDHLCDDIGIDTIEFGGTMGVAMDEGEVEWGDEQAVYEILEEIRKGSKRGQLFGNGVKYIGKELNAKRVPQVKGQGISAYDPRVFKGMGVTFATSPMGADHTSGAAIAGRKANQKKDYGDLTENEGKLDLSFELQLYISVLDSMGCCYFIGPNYQTMGLLAKTINAMYGTDLTREEVVDIGRHLLKIELDYNNKAGVGQSKSDVPEFFRKEKSDPTGLTYTFPKEELDEMWDKLNE